MVMRAGRRFGTRDACGPSDQEDRWSCRLGYRSRLLGQSRFGFCGLRRMRKLAQNFTPRRAVVVILFCFSIENKSNALTAITIQPAVVQKVTKRRRQTSTDV